MRIIGLDVGSKTIGVAVSDEMGYTAQGVTTIRRSGETEDVAAVAALVKEYGASEVVVGLPRQMDGALGTAAQSVLAFTELLAPVGIEITTWDERLSTVAATKMLIAADVSRKKRKKVIDKVAAVLILQSYLDYRALRSEKA
jgi:putative Holliday junction resolvase